MTVMELRGGEIQKHNKNKSQVIGGSYVEEGKTPSHDSMIKRLQFSCL